MKAYIDSSVLLRILFSQPHALKDWKSIEQGISSALIEVECLRTLDRLKSIEQLDEKKIASRREAVFRLSKALLSLN